VECWKLLASPFIENLPPSRTTVSYPKLKHWASCFIVHNLCLKNKEVINSTGFLFSFEEN
jgi:hypothetical protein